MSEKQYLKIDIDKRGEWGVYHRRLTALSCVLERSIEYEVGIMTGLQSCKKGLAL